MPNSKRKKDLSKLIDKQWVRLDLSSPDYHAAVNELGILLSEQSVVLDAEKLKEELFNRSDSAPMIAEGVIFPHVRSQALSDFAMVIGRTVQSFVSDNGNHFRLIVAMGSPAAKVQEHLEWLAALGRVLKAPGVIDALNKASTPEEFAGIITKPL